MSEQKIDAERRIILAEARIRLLTIDINNVTNTLNELTLKRDDAVRELSRATEDRAKLEAQ